MFLRAIGKLRAPFFARGKVAALNYETGDDARKRRRLECTGGSEIEKITHALRRFRGKHFDDDRSLLSFNCDALAGHLFDGRAVKGLWFRLRRFCGPRVGFLERL